MSAKNSVIFDDGNDVSNQIEKVDISTHNTQQISSSLCAFESNFEVQNKFYISNPENFYATPKTIFSQTEITFNKNILTEEKNNLLKLVVFTKQTLDKRNPLANKHHPFKKRINHKTLNIEPDSKITSLPLIMPYNGNLLLMVNKIAVTPTSTFQKTKQAIKKISVFTITTIDYYFCKNTTIKKTGVATRLTSNTFILDLIYPHLSRPPPYI